MQTRVAEIDKLSLSAAHGAGDVYKRIEQWTSHSL